MRWIPTPQDPALIALGDKIKIKGPKGERTIRLTERYTGDGKRPVDLGPADIVTEVTIPVPPKNSSSAHMKYRIREAKIFTIKSNKLST